MKTCSTLPSRSSRLREGVVKQILSSLSNYLSTVERYGRHTKVGLLVAAGCQIAAVWITWPVWSFRAEPPNIPYFGGYFGQHYGSVFGWLMIASALLAMRFPRFGSCLHLIVLGISCLLDQFRIQPQFLSVAVLMIACGFRRAEFVGRWMLVSLWFWAGLHKVLSPDWFGHVVPGLLQRINSFLTDWSSTIAAPIAIFEVGLGITAAFRPRVAAVIAVFLHLGIIAYLVSAGWNFSVIPWNICIAITGYSILSKAEPALKARGIEAVIAGLFLVVPVGFYFGWTDRAISAVLYSDNLPRGVITTKAGPKRIRGYGDLRVPFPNNHRSLVEYLRQTATPGAKLHISDPRHFVDDGFYVLGPRQEVQRISRTEFYGTRVGFGQGIGLDEKRSMFALSRAGVRLLRRDIGQPIYAADFSETQFEPDLLRHLRGLPNLEQIQFSGIKINDSDLDIFFDLPVLYALGLDNTLVSSAGIERLEEHPTIKVIEYQGAQIYFDNPGSEIE
ncbi:MAG: hypothetical protein AAF664_11050 [Planctomycetota bacterium]